MTTSQLSAFFNPQSVAVVGASADPKKPGNTIIRNMLAMGFKGGLYPINPREQTICGQPCFKSVSDIPDPVELVVLIVAAEGAVPVARELAERKKRMGDVKAVVCMSAGFGEVATAEANQREKDLVSTLRAADIRLVGPNCVGVIDAVTGLNTNFDIGAYPSGGISVLTQSGAFGNSFLLSGGTTGRVGLNKFVSVGNMADVQMDELLRFLKDDDSTKVIGIYLEGLSDPRGFFQAAREVSAVKPIVVLKSGRSELGSTAALSHTGAIAGADNIYDGAFEQFGLIRTRSVADFFDALRAFSKQPVPRGNRVAVMTHMGGPGTMCIDEIATLPAIAMGSFSAETVAGLKAILPSAANIGHPSGYIDMTATNDETLHSKMLNLLFKDPGVDMVIQILGPSAFHRQAELAKETASAFEAQGKDKKPLLNAVIFGNDFAADLKSGLEQAGLPTFEYSDSVARVAGLLGSYAAMRQTLSKSAKGDLAAKNDGPTAKLISAAAREGRASLLEPEAYGVCEQYGVKVPPFKLVDSLDGAVAAAKSIGYPVVIKVVSAKILHKSDIGGVMLGIGSDDQMTRAYAQLAENVRKAAPDIQSPQVLVQKMMAGSTELVLGAIRDKLFGPVVMFGLGGIYVEVLKKVGFRLAPLDIGEARALIEKTLPPKLIAGARGRKPMNVDGIAGTIVALGRLLLENPDIDQVDLNPCLAVDDGCLAVDARIILASDGK